MALMRGNYNSPENRRRRDSRGRYMEGDYGARNEYDSYMTYDEYDAPYMQPESRRRMGFGRYAMDDREMNDNDIRRRGTGMEDGTFSEQGEDYRYPTSRGGGQRMSMGGGGHQQMGKVMPMRGGMKETMDEVRPLDRKAAEEWVRSMCNTDPERPEGECWTMEEVKELVKKLHMPMTEKKLVEFYAIINAMYSDFYGVAEKFGLVNDEFFAELAKAWLADEDAVKDKAAAYYQYIVEK